MPFLDFSLLPLHFIPPSFRNLGRLYYDDSCKSSLTTIFPLYPKLYRLASTSLLLLLLHLSFLPRVPISSKDFSSSSLGKNSSGLPTHPCFFIIFLSIIKNRSQCNTNFILPLWKSSANLIMVTMH